METSKKGGARKGAGRKKIENRKLPVVIYVEELKIKNLGGIDKLKDSLISFVDGRDNPFENAARGRDKSGINEDELKAEIKFKPTKKKYDNPKMNVNIQDEPKQWDEGPKEGSAAFFMKHGVATYSEIKKKKDEK